MTLSVEIDDDADGRVVIEQPLQLELLGDGELPPLPVRVVLAWTSDDPLVVDVDFVRVEAQWLWGRDLLHRGLTEPAGFGDLRVRPCGPDEVQIELSTHDGHAELVAPADELRAFLDRTYAAVPAGREYAPGTTAGESFDWELLLIESGAGW
jgi:hypothetical protein